MDKNESSDISDIENEPTPYSVDSETGSKSPASHKGTLRISRQVRNSIFAIIALAALGGAWIIAAEFGFGGHASPPSSSATSTTSNIATKPSIAISIRPGTQGMARLTITWNDLPGGTTAIDIYYSPTQDGIYRLIGTIQLGSLSPTNGSGSLIIPAGDENGYFYGQASGGDGSPLWTSSSTPPTDGSSTTPGNDGGGNTPPTNNPPGNNPQNPTSTSTSTNTTSTQNDGQGNNGSQTSTSGTPSQNFVVEHLDQKIQISWQFLPAGAFEVVVSRSASNTGPWTPVLTETNIANDGPYSILIVDDTLGEPYYYEMNAEDNNGNSLASYGPTLLSPLPM